MMYAFNDIDAPSTRRSQYFEMCGSRAIYNDGWVAATTPFDVPWASLNRPSDVINDCNREL